MCHDRAKISSENFSCEENLSLVNNSCITLEISEGANLVVRILVKTF